MRTIRSWHDVPPAIPGEVLVIDFLSMLGPGENHLIPPRYSVEIAHDRSIAHFFEEQDAIEYALAIESKIISPTQPRKEPK